MTINQIVAALIAAFVFAALPASSEAAPAAARQWNVNYADQLSYAVEYELYNTSEQIGYENRTFGVDLGWVRNGGHFEFRRQVPPGTTDHRKGPIPADANVAIYNTKTRRYLKYYDRGDTKAELEWSDTPVYQWQLQDQSAASGGRVHFALFNTRVKKYLVHKVQNYGINLGWYNVTPPAPQSFSVALSAQQITNGWVPYLGSFGQNTKGNLLTVQNASQAATLLFVKPGKSTSDCSDPNATLRVAPRGVFTADQMKTLYGSATPRLPINFLACLTTPTPQSISLTFLNITYKLDN